ncbi:MAG: D-alanyl-D-alanine carboxypeptidase, partial [Oscillospiraceae bacterium]
MKKLLALLLILALILPLQAFAAGPDTKAKAVFLMEKDSGIILHEENAHDRLEPASVTKIISIASITESCGR